MIILPKTGRGSFMLLKNNRILPLLTAFVVLACVLASCVSTPSRPAESGVEAGTCGYVLDKQNRWYIGHAGIFIRRGPVWSYFEINGLNECQLPADETVISRLRELLPAVNRPAPDAAE